MVDEVAPALLATQIASRRLPPVGDVWLALPQAPKFVATSAVVLTVSVAACATPGAKTTSAATTAVATARVTVRRTARTRNGSCAPPGLGSPIRRGWRGERLSPEV